MQKSQCFQGFSAVFEKIQKATIGPNNLQIETRRYEKIREVKLEETARYKKRSEYTRSRSIFKSLQVKSATCAFTMAHTWDQKLLDSQKFLLVLSKNY